MTEQRLTAIEQKVDRILDLLQTDVEKMRNHIDFVESVYETVKTPLHFFINGVQRIMHTRAYVAIQQEEEENGKKEE